MEKLLRGIATVEASLKAFEPQRKELKEAAYAKKRKELRDAGVGKLEPIVLGIWEVRDNAEAQLEHAYRIDVIRLRQQFHSDPVTAAQLATAYRSELQGASMQLLLMRAEEAAAEGLVAGAVAIEEELQRRSEAGNPLPSHAARAIRNWTTSTSNNELEADLAARKALIETTHLASSAALALGGLLGTTKPIDRISHGLRVEIEMQEFEPKRDINNPTLQ